jgi:YesN/AraC family two-component response regulator
MDLEVQLTNYTKNGDSENMQRLLESIFQVNFNHNRLSPDMVRWLFMELQSTLLKLMDTLRLDYNQIFNNDKDIFYFMTETATAEVMFKRIKGMYHEICLNIKEERTDHSVVVYEKITRFIEQHYHDHNLGLTMLSDQLKLNPIYISAFFKKHSGDNITNFITAIRIQHVKELLSEDMTVQDIALRVGYANNIVLTKIFKKIEGITPGKYRERFKKHEND